MTGTRKGFHTRLLLDEADLARILHAISQCPAMERPTPVTMGKLERAYVKLGYDPPGGPAMSLIVLTRKQLGVLESLARPSEMSEYYGAPTDELQAISELEAKGLAARTPVGELPPWRLTAFGRRTLKESVERASE
jgi:hypothetical protein